MGKIDSNKKQKKEALLNTAFDLFTSKGIHETSISDIVNKAGVAKGTFYLYFKDKFDVRNLLISHKSSQLFISATNAAEEAGITDFDSKILFIINHIIDKFSENKSLLTFISKNLSWGFFKQALTSGPSDNSDVDFVSVYKDMLENSGKNFKEPELMLFMIIELVSSTCYSTILYNEPVSIDELKPHLFRLIKEIIRNHTIESSDSTEPALIEQIQQES